MSYKKIVLEKYPDAYAAQDVDGFWHIWTPALRASLSNGRYDTRSATKAWRQVAISLVAINSQRAMEKSK